jgi:raffinose/stachyose/melibiose transport system permease protein
MQGTLRDWRAVLVFVGPAVLLYTLILIVPIIWSLGYTLFSGSIITGFTFVGLNNFVLLWQDQKFWDALWFGTKYAVVVSSGQVFLGLLLALLYAFYLRKSSVWVRTFVFLPVVLPTVAVGQMFAKLFAIAPQYGLVNSFLQSIGQEGLVRAWLGEAGSAFWIIAVMDIWRAMGFYAVLLFAGIVEIPEEVLDAAKLDGAKGWNLARFVVVPLILPIIVSSLIFSLNGTLKVFDTILTLTGGGPGTSTMPLTMYFQRVAFTYTDYGYGSVIALALTFQCLIVTLLIFRRARKDVT